MCPVRDVTYVSGRSTQLRCWLSTVSVPGKVSSSGIEKRFRRTEKPEHLFPYRSVVLARVVQSAAILPASTRKSIVAAKRSGGKGRTRKQRGGRQDFDHDLTCGLTAWLKNQTMPMRRADIDPVGVQASHAIVPRPASGHRPRCQGDSAADRLDRNRSEMRCHNAPHRGRHKRPEAIHRPAWR